MIPILDALKSSLTVLQHRFRRRLSSITSSLTKGLTSLPDDLLPLIFEFATPPGEGSSRQAVWLSHVSRRFRSIALETRCLWTTFDGNATAEELDAFITRSGNHRDLDIVIHGTMSNGKLHDFLDVCLPMASHWSTLTVASSNDLDTLSTVDAVLQCMFDCRPPDELVFPQLHTLRLKQRRPIADTGVNTWTTAEKFVPNWTTPALCVIQCDEYIPRFSQSYAALRVFSTSVSLVTDEYPTQFEDLLLFIASASGITTLDLTICTIVNFTQSLLLTNTSCPSITSLTLEFPSLFLSGGTTELLYPLMHSLDLPNLETFSASVEIRYDDLVDDPEHSYALDHVLFSLLGPGNHPSLTSLSVELKPTDAVKDWRWRSVENRVLDIPLHEIPQVATLSVKTFTKIKFSRLGVVANGDCSALRELRLHECKRLDVEAIERVIESLKEVKAWDALRSLKLERCGMDLGYEDLVKMTGDKMLFYLH